MGCRRLPVIHGRPCDTYFNQTLGLIAMITLISVGFLMKFKLCPKALRKYAHRIHTQPVIILAMFLVLTIGHLIVDLGTAGWAFDIVHHPGMRDGDGTDTVCMPTESRTAGFSAHGPMPR